MGRSIYLTAITLAAVSLTSCALLGWEGFVGFETPVGRFSASFKAAVDTVKERYESLLIKYRCGLAEKETEPCKDIRLSYQRVLEKLADRLVALREKVSRISVEEFDAILVAEAKFLGNVSREFEKEITLIAKKYFFPISIFAGAHMREDDPRVQEYLWRGEIEKYVESSIIPRLARLTAKDRQRIFPALTTNFANLMATLRAVKLVALYLSGAEGLQPTEVANFSNELVRGLTEKTSAVPLSVSATGAWYPLTVVTPMTVAETALKAEEITKIVAKGPGGINVRAAYIGHLFRVGNFYKVRISAVEASTGKIRALLETGQVCEESMCWSLLARNVGRAVGENVEKVVKVKWRSQR